MGRESARRCDLLETVPSNYLDARTLETFRLWTCRSIMVGYSTEVSFKALCDVTVAYVFGISLTFIGIAPYNKVLMLAAYADAMYELGFVNTSTMDTKHLKVVP
jgi:hypothetical protein